jgi:hypothetical protein
MSSFTTFFRDFDASPVFDKLTQTVRVAQALCNRATAILHSTDPSVAAGTALVPFVQDVQPVFNRRMMQATKAVTTATQACQKHRIDMTATEAADENANAAHDEKVRLENVKHQFTIQEENKRHERKIKTLDDEHKSAVADRTAIVKQEKAKGEKLQKVLDTAQDNLLQELRFSGGFLVTSGLVTTIKDSPAGGAAVGVDVSNAVGADDDNDLEEGEVRCGKRGRDDSADDAAAGTASKKAKLC